MNILILSQFFSSTKGGGEYFFSLLAKKLVQKDHKVWVITNKIEGEDYQQHENLKLIFIPPTLQYKGGIPPGFLDNFRYLYNAIMKGHKIIRQKNIDIIHSNNFAPALAGSILSSITNKKHVTTIHDVFSLCGKDYWKLWGKQNDVSKINVWLAPFFEKQMIKFKQNCIHTVSDATKDDLLHFGAKKPIYVIPNSVEIPQNSDNTPVNLFQFIYVGRLVFYKNLEVVIKAINLAKKIEPKIKLIIVGGGPHRKTLEDLSKKLGLESHIEFKGYVSAAEKAKLITSSCALVFPSLCEGFGIVILEAFSQKKPVLVSNVRPMSDIVSNGENGYVLDPHDETKWALVLEELIENPDKGIKFGIHGNKILKQKYTLENLYEKIFKMYNDALI